MKKILLALSLLIQTANVFAAYQDAIPKNMPADSRWTFSRANACLKADNIHRTAANGECLALQTYFSNQFPTKNPILLIFIHGDGIPGGGPSDYLKYQATKFIRPDLISTLLIRPGYYDSYDNYSTGESFAFSNHGYPADSYRQETIATLAAAVTNLKNFYRPRCTILIGHSGGGIMSGVIIGKYQNLVNSAVLASVVGDVERWAKSHHWGDYSHSLSPNQFVTDISKQTSIHIVSGTKDENTFPTMTKTYYDLLKSAGKKVYWYSQPEGDHNSIVISQTRAFEQAINDAIGQCPNNFDERK